MIWTFCVAIAVLLAALYNLSTPRLTFNTDPLPEGVRTGAPLAPRQPPSLLPSLSSVQGRLSIERDLANDGHER
jgi:hypothetical protein